jgi:hypothetical protein
MTSKTRKFRSLRPPVTRRDLVGAQMSNFLYSLKQKAWLPEELRQQAEELQKQWDEVATLRVINPITMIELEKRLPPR